MGLIGKDEIQFETKHIFPNLPATLMYALSLTVNTEKPFICSFVFNKIKMFAPLSGQAGQAALS